MKTNSLRCVLALALFCLCCIGAEHGHSRPQTVSLVRLIARPEAYDRKRVSVRGFYHNEFESSALYLCKEDARRLINENGIWVGNVADGSDTNKFDHVNDDYVLIEGTFDYTPQGGGHMGGWFSELKDITLFVRLPKRSISSDRE